MCITDYDTLAYPPTSLFKEVKALSYPRSDLDVRKLYAQRYDIDYWIEGFADITFNTRMIGLSLSNMRILNQLCKVAKSSYMNHVKQCLKTPDSWFDEVLSKVTVEESKVIKELCQKINLNTDSFIKLSSRSPKDSFLLPHKECGILKSLLEKGIDKELAEEVAETESMKVRNGKEAIELLMISQRVEDDLENMLEWDGSLCTGEGRLKAPMSLIIREWRQIPKWGEFRGFVCKGKLNAVTQYFCDSTFPYLIKKKKEIEKMILDFFESSVKHRLDLLKIYHAVIDFGITLNENNELRNILLLELNSFGIRSGAGLFAWDKEDDLNIMLNGPFTFRMVENEVVKKEKSCLSTYNCTITV